MTDPIDQIREAARGSIDSDLLTGEGLLRGPPVYRYLRADETLHYLFSNRSRGLTAAKLLHPSAPRDFTVSDATRKDPGTNYAALMLVTSKRVVFLVGRATEDKTFAVEPPDITAVQYQEEGPNRQLSVRNSKLKYTFVPEQRSEIAAAANYIRSRLGGGTVDTPTDTDAPTETSTDSDTTAGTTDSTADSESNAQPDPESVTEPDGPGSATAGDESTTDGPGEPADSPEGTARAEMDPEDPEPEDDFESLPGTVTERIDRAIELLEVGDPFETPDETYRAAVEAHTEFCAAIEALPEAAEGSPPAEELAERTARLETVIDLLTEYRDPVTRAGELADDGADAPADERSSLVSELTALRGELSELGVSSTRVDQLVGQLSDDHDEGSAEPDDETVAEASADGEGSESDSEGSDAETGPDFGGDTPPPRTLEDLPRNGRFDDGIPVRVDHISSDDDGRVVFRGVDTDGEEVWVNINARRNVEWREGVWYVLDSFWGSTRERNDTTTRNLRTTTDSTVVDLGETPPFAATVDLPQVPDRSTQDPNDDTDDDTDDDTSDSSASDDDEPSADDTDVPNVDSTPPRTLAGLPDNGRLDDSIPVRLDHLYSDDDGRVVFRGVDTDGEEVWVTISGQQDVEWCEGPWYLLDSFSMSTRERNGTTTRNLRTTSRSTVVDLGESPSFETTIDLPPKPERSSGETDEGAAGETDGADPNGESEAGDDGDDTGDGSLDPGTAALAEYYDVFYQLDRLVDRLVGGTPHGEESTMVAWHDALEAFLTEGLADWEQGYGPAQGETETSISEYRDRFGTGDRVTSFQRIDVAPADPVVHTLLVRTKVVSDAGDEPFAVPVSPETETPLPVFVENDAALETACDLLAEFPDPTTLTAEPGEGDDTSGTDEPTGGGGEGANGATDTAGGSAEELRSVAGVTKHDVEVLVAAGYTDRAALQRAAVDDLASIEGISRGIALRIKADVGGV